MKDLIMSHGFAASALVLLACFNVMLTAIKTVLDKIEAYLLPAGQAPDPNAKLVKASALLGSICGKLSSVIDWLTGNKEH